jgi:hypothetical protein
MPKRTNPWVAHVQSYKRNHPGLTYKTCMKEARPSYRGQKGEGLWDDAKGFLKKHKVLSTVGRALTPLVKNELLGNLANRGVSYLEQNGYGQRPTSSTHGRVKF